MRQILGVLSVTGLGSGLSFKLVAPKVHLRVLLNPHRSENDDPAKC